MRLLLDQGIARLAATQLRELGHDAEHVGDRGLAQASDEMILEAARDEHRVVVTLDADFHRLLALSSADAPSVLRIRIEGLNVDQQVALIEQLINECGELLVAGAVVTVHPHEWRARRLPMGRQHG